MVFWKRNISCSLDLGFFFPRFPFSNVLLGLCSADYPKNAVVIDNINVFRPDRVFMVKLSFAEAFSQDSNFIINLILSHNIFCCCLAVHHRNTL